MAAVLLEGEHCYHLSSCCSGTEVGVAASCRDGAAHLLTGSGGARVRHSGSAVIDEESEILRTGWHGRGCLVGASAGGELSVLRASSPSGLVAAGGAQCDDQVYGYVNLDKVMGGAPGLAEHSALVACGTTIHLLEFGSTGTVDGSSLPISLTIKPLADLAQVLPSAEELACWAETAAEDSSSVAQAEDDPRPGRGMPVDDWEEGEEEAMLSDSTPAAGQGAAFDIADEHAAGHEAEAGDTEGQDEDEDTHQPDDEHPEQDEGEDDEEEEEPVTREVFDLVELPRLALNPASGDAMEDRHCLVAMTLSSGEVAVAAVMPARPSAYGARPQKEEQQAAAEDDDDESGASDKSSDSTALSFDVVSYIPAAHTGAAICACAMPRVATSSGLHRHVRDKDGGDEEDEMKDCFVFATAGLDGYVRLWDLRQPPEQPAGVLSGMCDGAVFSLWAPALEQRVPAAAGLGGDSDWAIVGVGGAVVMAWDVRRASCGVLSASDGLAECRRAGAVSDFHALRGGVSGLKDGPVAVLGLPLSKLHALAVCGEEVLVGGEVVLPGNRFCTVASVSLDPIRVADLSPHRFDID